MNAADIFANITAFFTNQFLLYKTALSIVILVFSFFTIILARQIGELTTIINQVSFTPVLKFFAYSLIFITFGLLVLTILV